MGRHGGRAAIRVVEDLDAPLAAAGTCGSARVEAADERPARIFRWADEGRRLGDRAGPSAIRLAWPARPGSRARGERGRATLGLGQRAVRDPRVPAGRFPEAHPLALQRPAWRAGGARVRAAGAADPGHPPRPVAPDP